MLYNCKIILKIFAFSTISFTNSPSQCKGNQTSHQFDNEQKNPLKCQKNLFLTPKPLSPYNNN